MAQTIKLKRGTQSQIDAGSLSIGECGLATDTKLLYIGDGVGKNLIGRAFIDTFANRPTAANSGRFFYASDTSTLYLDDGTTWNEIGGGGGGVTWNITSATITAAVKDNGYALVATADSTVNLPPTPTASDVVWFLDAADKATTYVLKLGRNGSNIHSQSQDLTIDTNGAGFGVVYVNASIGWKIFSEITSQLGSSSFSQLEVWNFA